MPVYVDEEDEPCIALQNLFKPEEANLKNLTDYLSSKLAENKEFGFLMERRRTDNYYSSFPCENLTTAYILSCSTAPKSYGIVHTHYDTRERMFSWADLLTLKNLHHTSYDENKSRAVIVLVTHDKLLPLMVKVYAVKIDNYETFKNKMDEEYNHSDYINLSDGQKIKAINDKVQKLYSTNQTNLRGAFLSYFSSYGISLYEANAERTDWNKLSRGVNASNPNIPGQPISNPCR